MKTVFISGASRGLGAIIAKTFASNNYNIIINYNKSEENAFKLEKLIKDCGLVEYEGCTHYAYLERLGQTINIINSFIGG